MRPVAAFAVWLFATAAATAMFLVHLHPPLLISTP